MAETVSGRGLGLVSFGVGTTELLAPGKLEETMGIGDGENTGIFRVLAVREFCHGFDLLMHDNPVPGLWGRVAGDVLDGILLAVAGARARKPSGLAMVAAALLPVVLADLKCATKATFK